MLRYNKNDAIHPLLSKAQPPAQSHIDTLGVGHAKPTYGSRRILEVDAGQALTDFSMGGRVKDTAWSLNPYTGCLHACAFCYVPETMHVERDHWGSYIIAKTNLPTRLARELSRRPRRTVYLSTGTDPYQSPEAEHRITRACLVELAKKDWPIEIITRSPLVLRDADVLRRFSRLQIGLSVPTLDDEARRLMEPAAPPIPARLAALRRLSGLGLRVYANYVPVYPPTNGFTLQDVAEAFRDAGVLWVNSSAWSRQAGYLGALWDRVRGTAWEDLARFVGNPVRQERLRERLGKALEKVGIPMRSGFFNKPYVSESTTRDSRLEADPTLEPGPASVAVPVSGPRLWMSA